MDEIKHVKVGRPKNEKEFNRKEYNKNYYDKHKEKTKGTYICPVCNLLCSISNRSRHNQSSLHKKQEEQNIKEYENQYGSFY